MKCIKCKRILKPDENVIVMNEEKKEVICMECVKKTRKVKDIKNA